MPLRHEGDVLVVRTDTGTRGQILCISYLPWSFYSVMEIGKFFLPFKSILHSEFYCTLMLAVPPVSLVL